MISRFGRTGIDAGGQKVRAFGGGATLKYLLEKKSG
jgi:hypothetical protein